MNTNKFVIMYKEHPISIVDFYDTGFPSEIREHNTIKITSNFSEVSYLKSYDAAMARMHLIRDAISNNNIKFACSGDINFKFDEPVNPNDFRVSRVCFSPVDSSVPLNRPSVNRPAVNLV